MQDRDAARLLLWALHTCFPRVGKVWADGGYAGRLVDLATTTWTTAVEPLAAQIATEFNQACCQLGQILHTSGVITRSVGRPVPVLVHDLEYYEAIAGRTEAANPPGLADEFAAWIREG